MANMDKLFLNFTMYKVDEHYKHREISLKNHNYDDLKI